MPWWLLLLADQIHDELIRRLRRLVVPKDVKRCGDVESIHRVLSDALADILLPQNLQLACNKEVCTYLTCHRQLEYLNDRGIRRYLQVTSSSSGALSYELQSANQESSP